MNNQLIDKALEYLNSIEAFADKEVPAYIHELLQFKAFEHLIDYFDDFLITIPIAILGIYFYKRATKYLEGLDKDSYDYKSKYGLQYFGIFLVIPLLISISANHNLIQAYKAYKAPRVYLIDYFSDKVTKNKQ